AADPACAALGCEPDGKCVVGQDGTRSCQWASPCGACPTGATCKTVPAASNNSVPVPYCACPDGYGMTPTDCIQGENSTVSSSGMTVIGNRTAQDKASRPYTFRLNPNACTPFPDAIARTFSTLYTIANIPDAPRCPKMNLYATNNCQGTPTASFPTNTRPLFATYAL
ncbi:unnamed protein product, partial [Closterium sp. Naga37s-1]